MAAIDVLQGRFGEAEDDLFRLETAMAAIRTQSEPGEDEADDEHDEGAAAELYAVWERVKQAPPAARGRS